MSSFRVLEISVWWCRWVLELEIDVTSTAQRHLKPKTHSLSTATHVKTRQLCWGQLNRIMAARGAAFLPGVRAEPLPPRHSSVLSQTTSWAWKMSISCSLPSLQKGWIWKLCVLYQDNTEKLFRLRHLRLHYVVVVETGLSGVIGKYFLLLSECFPTLIRGIFSYFLNEEELENRRSAFVQLDPVGGIGHPSLSRTEKPNEPCG